MRANRKYQNEQKTKKNEKCNQLNGDGYNNNNSNNQKKIDMKKAEESEDKVKMNWENKLNI